MSFEVTFQFLRGRECFITGLAEMMALVDLASVEAPGRRAREENSAGWAEISPVRRRVCERPSGHGDSFSLRCRFEVS